jgi:hypothetical protein
MHKWITRLFLSIDNAHKIDGRERIDENFETCLLRGKCAPQFSECIHKKKRNVLSLMLVFV